MPHYAIQELAAALARCVRRRNEDARDKICNLINGDAKPSQEEFDSLPQDQQNLLTSVCGYTRPVE